MAHLITRVHRAWRWWVWRWAVPGVLDDGELLELLHISASDMAAIKCEADARHRGNAPRCYWLDGQRRRQWALRQTLPIAVRTIRGMR
jgi:hypothetical protein